MFCLEKKTSWGQRDNSSDSVPFFLRNNFLVVSGLWRTREFCKNFTAVAIYAAGLKRGVGGERKRTKCKLGQSEQTAQTCTLNETEQGIETQHKMPD